ncbi:hypothetical protein ACIRF8_19770 [Streptomyces sp. NPDC102406]|uniref:hypothetical protein n=1 Tax=Streptomyces sp. NPDC102406 TaxID=3366171 RepID=UPI003801A545
MIIAGADVRGDRSARWLLVALLLAAGCWSAAGPSAADGAGTRGLTLDVTVNTRPGLGALRPGIRTGAPVVKSYRLVNRGGADLHEVRVRDPGMPGAVIRCPGGPGRVPLLAGLRSARCTATGPARPGPWIGDVQATGQARLRAIVRATARSGYTGVGATLTLTETARVTGQDRARLHYVLANHGNRPLHGVRLTDQALPRERIICPGGRPVVAHLAAGARAVCTAVVRRTPGTYLSSGRADGSDLLRTLDPRGGRAPAPRLTAHASARFTLRAPAHATPAPPPKHPAPAAPGKQPHPAPPPARHPRPAPPVAALLLLTPPPPGVAAPGLVPPGAATTGPLPPGAVPPGSSRPGGAVPGVGADPAVPGTRKGAAKTPASVPPPTVPTAAVPSAAESPTAHPQKRAASRPSLLRRFVREDHRPTDLGVLTALFLVLLPAAVAAAVFGSRRL